MSEYIHIPQGLTVQYSSRGFQTGLEVLIPIRAPPFLACQDYMAGR